MNLTEKREEVLQCCENAYKKCSDIQNKDIHVLMKKMAEHIQKRANHIQKLCEVEQYDLYFNGKVGIGKSTTICTMFDLINHDVLTEGIRLSDALLLKTGSGRITICETQIIPNSDSTEIRIEEVSCGDFYQYIEGFVEVLHNKKSTLSSEMITLIKNMANIPLNLSNEEVIELFSCNQESQLITALQEAIRYESRTEKTIPFDGTDCKRWLKNTFEEINDGNRKASPMPRNLIIKISDKDLPLQIPSYIRSVIDTRGLDGGERPDIQEYLARENGISIMCDEIAGYGGNEEILSILRQTLTFEEKDYQHRVVLLGMEKDGELCNITNFLEDREGGMQSKSAEAMRRMNDSKISFLKDNFLFIDTVPGICLGNAKVNRIDQDTCKTTQREFLDNIGTVLSNMYSKYCIELYRHLEVLEQLSHGHITTETECKIEKCRKLVDTMMQEVMVRNHDILKRFEEELVKYVNHSSLRGAVNHLGIGNTANIYGSFQKCGVEEFKAQYSDYKLKMITQIEGVFDECTELEETCLQYIKDDLIDGLYNECYKQYKTLTYSEIYDQLYNVESWSTPRKYWGDGLGKYNLRVWTDICKELRKHHIDEILNEHKIIIQFFQDVLTFLTI